MQIEYLGSLNEYESMKTENYIFPIIAKGQFNSEWIYEVIVSPKMPTKNLKDFCPGSL